MGFAHTHVYTHTEIGAISIILKPGVDLYFHFDFIKIHENNIGLFVIDT